MSTPEVRDLRELVVPLDGRDASLRAIPVAARLSKRLGMSIRLCSVGADATDWLPAVADEHLAGHEVAVDVIPDGDPVDGIVKLAGERGIVCMATAASIGLHDGRIGSVAEGVVRLVGRPVVLAGPSMEGRDLSPTQRIVCPVDGSHTSEAALATAGSLAKRFDVPLWVVTVISPKAESAARAGLGGDPSMYEAGYVRSLARTQADKHGIDGEYDVLHGDDAAAAIVDFAGDDGTVVMSTHGRSGIRRVFGGSVAMGVVAHSQRAVVVWRPEED